MLDSGWRVSGLVDQLLLSDQACGWMHSFAVSMNASMNSNDRHLVTLAIPFRNAKTGLTALYPFLYRASEPMFLDE